MLISEAKRAAKARYDAKTAKKYSLKLNINTDGDLIEHLAKQENVQGYLKELIRRDMAPKETTAQSASKAADGALATLELMKEITKRTRE